MAAIPDLNPIGKIHDRTGVIVITCDICKRTEHVEGRNRLRGLLHTVHFSGNLIPHLDKNIIFQRRQPFLRAEHRAFKLFEFLRDIAFTVCKCLLADVILRHSIQVRLADLDIIAEHTIIADLELADPRAVHARAAR